MPPPITTDKKMVTIRTTNLKSKTTVSLIVFKIKNVIIKANNKLTNMNLKKQYKSLSNLLIIFVFAQTQDLFNAGVGMTEVTIT